MPEKIQDKNTTGTVLLFNICHTETKHTLLYVNKIVLQE